MQEPSTLDETHSSLFFFTLMHVTDALCSFSENNNFVTYLQRKVTRFDTCILIFECQLHAVFTPTGYSLQQLLHVPEFVLVGKVFLLDLPDANSSFLAASDDVLAVCVGGESSDAASVR